MTEQTNTETETEINYNSLNENGNYNISVVPEIDFKRLSRINVTIEISEDLHALLKEFCCFNEGKKSYEYRSHTGYVVRNRWLIRSLLRQKLSDFATSILFDTELIENAKLTLSFGVIEEASNIKAMLENAKDTVINSMEILTQ